MEPLLFIHIIYFAAWAWIYFRMRSSSFYDPAFLYLIFHLVVFVWRPFMVIVSGYDHGWWYMQYQPTPQEMASALLISDIALAVFLFSSSTRFARLPQPVSSGGIPLAFSQTQRRSFLATVAIAAPIGVYSSIIATGSADTAEMGMVSLDGVIVNTATNGYLVDARNLLYGVILLIFYVFGFNKKTFLILALYTALRAYIGLSRWGVIYLYIALVALYLALQGRKWPRPTFIFAIPPIFLAFNAIGQSRDLLRNLLGKGTPARPTVFETQGFSKYDTLDFANFDYLTYVSATVPKLTGTYTYGTQYLQLFTEPIPRILWPSKPLGAPVQFFNLNDYGNFFGLTASLPGDGWMSGGWLGVVLTMALTAIFARYIYNTSAHESKGPPSAKFLFAIGATPLFLQLYRDGGISIFRIAFFSLMPILIWGLGNYLGRKSK